MGMILTQAGQNAVNALLASNGTLTIAEMSFGGADRHPTGGETALTNELIRKPVLNKTVEAEKTRFDARLEHDEGPFVIYEIGLHDENGTLIFVGRVDGLTKLVNAGGAHSIDMSASVFTSNFQNVVVKVDSNFAFVPAARKVDAGTGLTGGGDLSADRTLAVDFADDDEALAGTEADKTISPATLQTVIDGLSGVAPIVENLNTWNKTGPIRFSPTAIGSPPNDFDGRGIHIQGPNQASQIAVMGTELVMFRDKDTDGEPWGPWTEILNQFSGQELAYSTGNAPDNWLIGENFAGDTSVSLGEVWGRCHRIGNMAQIALKLNFSGFSIPANTDNTVSTSVDINALAAAAGWFAEIDGNSLGDVRAQFTGSTWDSPPFSMYCSTSKSAGTIFLSCNDMTHLGAQSSNATALDVTLTLYLKVND